MLIVCLILFGFQIYAKKDNFLLINYYWNDFFFTLFFGLFIDYCVRFYYIFYKLSEVFLINH